MKCIFVLSSTGNFICKKCGYLVSNKNLQRECSGVMKVDQSTETRSVVCVHLGKVNKKIKCNSCEGNVRIKLFDCAIHKQCTLSKDIDDIACCKSCGDYISIT